MKQSTRFPSLIIPLIVLTFAAFLAVPASRAQEVMPKVADAPVEITSDTDFHFETGVGIAQGNVIIYSKDSTIFCDYAQYNPDTKDVLLKGHVKIYQLNLVFSGESALYNLETKNLRATDFLGVSLPYRFQGENLYTIPGGYGVKNGFFTTHDSSKPDFRVRARTVRIYPNDRIVFTNVTLFVGQTPLFWLPYMYQSLNETNSFLIMPGYSSNWGAFIMSTYTFPITDWIHGTAHLDYRFDRGPAAGLDLHYKFGQGDVKSWGDIKTYFLNDSATDTNSTSLSRPEVQTSRYRMSWESKMYFTDDWSASIDSTVLSDSKFLSDFYPVENSLNPQPDNVISTTYQKENWTFNVLARGQLNNFQEVTERLPEASFDVTRTQLFGLPIYYEGSTSGGFIGRAYTDDSGKEKLETGRFDTFHQLSFAHTYFGWLSIVPRAGFRATYYDRTYSDTSDSDANDPAWRTVYDLGIEASFKISRTWNNVESRFLGIDGLKHVIQPYANFSYTSEPSLTTDEIYQVDRYIASTQLPMFEFPQFTAIDSIQEAAVLRLGVRNRLLTKRDDQTMTWMELDTYFNVNYDNPYDDSEYSNLFNRFRFWPVPWVTLTLDTQVPAFDKDGFTEVNSAVSFMATKDLSVSVGHRYIENNTSIQDSSLLNFSVYYQIDENWAVSLAEEYEFADSTWQSQRYSFHRDLTSWVATVSAIIRDNGGSQQEYGLYLSLTLKDLPNLDFNLNLDPSSTGSNSQ